MTSSVIFRALVVKYTASLLSPSCFDLSLERVRVLSVMTVMTGMNVYSIFVITKLRNRTHNCQDISVAEIGAVYSGVSALLG